MTELSSIEQLRPAPYNPRDITEKAAKGLRASIKRFGDLSGITWNAQTGHVVSGHQRLAQLMELGGVLEGGAIVAQGKRFPVRVVHWDETTEKAANIAANNPHIAGTFTDGLRGVLDDIADFDGFDEMNFDDMSVPDVDILDPSDIEEDEIPEPPNDPITKPGDLWRLGDHCLMCGSSTSVNDVAALCDVPVNMMWTDPPYGVNYVGKTSDALTIRNDGPEDLGKLLSSAFEAINSHMVDGCPWYIAHPPGPLAYEFMGAVVRVGWRLHQSLVWKKDRMVLGHSDYHYMHEPILYGWKGKNRPWYSGRDRVSVLEYDRPSSNDKHPTSKPVALVVDGVMNSSKTGDIVVDLFCGSGTTLVACEQSGRSCRAMELDPKYCDVIIERWENLTGGKATRK